MNIGFLKSRVGDLNKSCLFSQLFKVISSTVTHTTLDSTSIALKNKFQWTSEGNITFNTFSTESLWIDITTSSLHFRNVCTQSSHTTIHFNKSAIFIESNTWTLFTTSNQSTNHDRTGTHSKSLTHVT